MNEAVQLVGFFLIAMLYASVGHGGATGYLALLTIVSTNLSPAEMSGTALLLNVAVSGLALVQFGSKEALPKRLTLLLLLTSVPAAYLGGLSTVPVWLFNTLLLFGLIFAALRLLIWAKQYTLSEPLWLRYQGWGAPLLGAGIGFISGVTGIGGGVFLSPLLLFLRWTSPRSTAAIAAAFVLLNSTAGLLARGAAGTLVFGSLMLPMTAAVAGGLLGSHMGARRLMPATLNRLLAVTLTIACGKLVLRLIG